MPDLITFGESMLRLSAPVGHALERAAQLDLHVAGAESNVAITASRMGLSAGWISRLPDNPLGRLVAHTVQSQGVDVSRVVWSSQGRMGTYYVEFGSTPRPNQVIYDRAGSAVTEINPVEVDWDYIASAHVLHLTGITPALSPSCAAVVEQAIQLAHERGIMISFDLNYRAKLWSPSTAATALEPLLPGVHILRMGRDEAQALFGLQSDTEQIAREVYARFRPRVAVVTDSGNPAVAFDGTTLSRVDCYTVAIVDEIGAGDAFTTGFLVGYLEHNSIERGLQFAQALAALKLTYAGDIAWCTRSDVEALMQKHVASWR